MSGRPDPQSCTKSFVPSRAITNGLWLVASRAMIWLRLGLTERPLNECGSGPRSASDDMAAIELKHEQFLRRGFPHNSDRVDKTTHQAITWRESNPEQAN